jgi:hypothetical protein
MPAAVISSARMASADFETPSRSTSVCKGSIRWFFPAAVMTALVTFTWRNW